MRRLKKGKGVEMFLRAKLGIEKENLLHGLHCAYKERGCPHWKNVKWKTEEVQSV